MQFYRRLSTIKAISFDLDDTLYNNRPVMQGIESKMVDYFTELFNQRLPEKIASSNKSGTFSDNLRLTPPFNRRFWAPFRQQSIQINPDISHDVVQHRFESYRLGFIAFNIPETEAAVMAQAALDYFIQLRSDFTVPKVSYELLASLSKQYPLVSISNGNVDTKVLGLDKYFTHIYHAGYQLGNTLGVVGGLPNAELNKHKPATDMFDDVCRKLSIQPHELLHVGDCGNADIHGALTAGCQTAWLPQYGVGKPLKQVPHIELKQVSDLLELI